MDKLGVRCKGDGHRFGEVLTSTFIVQNQNDRFFQSSKEVIRKGSPGSDREKT